MGPRRRPLRRHSPKTGTVIYIRDCPRQMERFGSMRQATCYAPIPLAFLTSEFVSSTRSQEPGFPLRSAPVVITTPEVRPKSKQKTGTPASLVSRHPPATEPGFGTSILSSTRTFTAPGRRFRASSRSLCNAGFVTTGSNGKRDELLLDIPRRGTYMCCYPPRTSSWFSKGKRSWISKGDPACGAIDHPPRSQCSTNGAVAD